jgi:hypothetical protein
MSGYNPNRVAAGKSTGGQFAAKVNGEQDIDLEYFEEYSDDSTDNDVIVNTYNTDLDLDDDDVRDWRSEVNFDSISAAETPEQLNALSDKLAENLPMRKSPIADHMGEIDNNLQESAALVRAIDYRAIRMLAHEKNREGFSKEYLDGLRDRVKVGVVREDRDKLRKITSPAYDKIDELNTKIEVKPNTPYTAKWKREADAQRRTALLARAEIMNLNEKERNEA